MNTKKVHMITAAAHKNEVSVHIHQSNPRTRRYARSSQQPTNSKWMYTIITLPTNTKGVYMNITAAYESYISDSFESKADSNQS